MHLIGSVFHALVWCRVQINGGAAMAAMMLPNGGNPQQPSPRRPEQHQQGAAGGLNASPASLLPNSAKGNKNSSTNLIKVTL